MCLCTYLFVLEGLHQLRHSTEGHGEGQMGAGVAFGDLNALVAKIPLPFNVMTDFILAKDVRYQAPCVKSRVGRQGGPDQRRGKEKPHYVSHQRVGRMSSD